jgi:hypothetical protein
LKRSVDVDVDAGCILMVRRRVSAVSNHVAPAVAAAGLSSFEAPLTRLLRMRIEEIG